MIQSRATVGRHEAHVELRSRASVLLGAIGAILFSAAACGTSGPASSEPPSDASTTSPDGDGGLTPVSDGAPRRDSSSSVTLVAKSVACGSSACDTDVRSRNNVCCIDTLTTPGDPIDPPVARCLRSTDCLNDEVVLGCDQREDCIEGYSCCVAGGDRPALVSNCSLKCTAPQRILCTKPADCPAGLTCAPISGPYTYGLGLSACQ